MAFVLLAIGALMSGAGIYAVIFGYSIIQLEEGWASVISGATLVAGGIVTIALALVLRTLNEVKAAFQASPVKVQSDMEPSLVSTPVEVPMRPNADLSDSKEELQKVEAPASAPSSAPTGSEIEKSPEDAPSASNATLEPLAAPIVADRAEEIHAPLAELEPPFEAPRAADDYKLETPSTPEHDLWPIARNEPAPVSAPAAPPQMDDWLDRAFAELDRDTPPLSPPKPVPPPSRKPVLETAAAEPSSAEAVHTFQSPTPASHETPSEPTPPTIEEPQPLPPSTSAVIGRYESDGTLYVMYADGSIEAQSASGLYRFASMAELKAFIEE